MAASLASALHPLPHHHIKSKHISEKDKTHFPMTQELVSSKVQDQILQKALLFTYTLSGGDNKNKKRFIEMNKAFVLNIIDIILWKLDIDIKLDINVWKLIIDHLLFQFCLMSHPQTMDMAETSEGWVTSYKYHNTFTHNEISLQETKSSAVSFNAADHLRLHEF
ncbi:hypothetical protein LXL04_003130 [Taraxacum kok-saghyz]